MAYDVDMGGKPLLVLERVVGCQWVQRERPQDPK